MSDENNIDNELLATFDEELHKGNITIREFEKVWGPFSEEFKEELATIKMAYVSKLNNPDGYFELPIEVRIQNKKYELFKVAMNEYFTKWWHPVRKLRLLFRIMGLLDEITKLELFNKKL